MSAVVFTHCCTHIMFNLGCLVVLGEVLCCMHTCFCAKQLQFDRWGEGERGERLGGKGLGGEDLGRSG